MNVRTIVKRGGALAAPDPRALLVATRAAVYDWDIAADQLTMGPDAVALLGAGFAAASASARAAAIRAAAESAGGAGGAYRVRYALERAGAEGRGAVMVEDAGRWFAGADGAPQRAHGLARLSAEEPAPRASESAPASLLCDRARWIGEVETLIARGQRRFCILLAAQDAARDDDATSLITTLAARSRVADRIACLAPGQFALLMPGCDAAQMAFAAARLTRAAPVRIGGVTAAGRRDACALLNAARQALDMARAGPMRFVAFDAARARAAARARTQGLADAIVAALNDRRIELAQAPCLGARAGDIAFHRASARLRRPDGARVFVRGAENDEIARLLDGRALELAVARLRDDPRLVLALDISGATLADADFARRATAMMGACAPRAILAIAERDAHEHPEAAKAIVAALRARGARAMIDGFGAGRLSAGDLARIGCDIVAIDGAFMQDLSRSTEARFHVRALLELARALGVRTLAQWVDDDDARLLAEWGVDFVQNDCAHDAWQETTASRRPSVREERTARRKTPASGARRA